jgi:hypothetical protein
MLSSFAMAPAHGQSVPPGSYLQSCRNIHTQGDRIVADCRRTDGSWGRTALEDVNRCAGGIANTDGRLTCNRADRGDRWSRDRDYGDRSRYRHDSERDYDRGPGYDTSRQYRPPAGYGPGYGR